ncbi:sialoadhesin-like [Heptranchias perlo]|uniref:sialoadhesin-like n=1 Tax=Heptranchias perlo TaxID=212740 RepID=UPI0035599C80
MGLFCVQFVSLVTCCFQVAVCSQWNVQHPPRVKGMQGSCVVIPCSFNYPGSGNWRHKITGIWYRDLPVGGVTVCHSDPNHTVSHDYSGRAEIVGDLNHLNCTCKIRNLGAGDKAKYFFRFEVTNVDRWTDNEGVYLNVSEYLERPTVDAITDVLEFQPITATCSISHSCPDNPIQLQWRGYNASNGSSLDGGSGRDGTIYRTLSFLATHLDHNRVLTCVAQVERLHLSSWKEIRLRVRHTAKDVRVLIFPTAKNPREGNPVTLFCDTSRSEPIVTSYK